GRPNDAAGGGDPDGVAGSADCVRADPNRTGPAAQQRYGVDAGMVRACRLQRRHRWPGTRVWPRAHKAPRLGTPLRATIWALKRELPDSERRNSPGPQPPPRSPVARAPHHEVTTVTACPAPDEQALLPSSG